MSTEAIRLRPILGPFEQLRLALNHFSDPQWLEAQSPLAAPYFLGESLRRSSAKTTAVSQGRVLQKELQSAATSLWGDNLPHDKESLLTAVNEKPKRPLQRAVF